MARTMVFTITTDNFSLDKTGESAREDLEQKVKNIVENLEQLLARKKEELEAKQKESTPVSVKCGGSRIKAFGEGFKIDMYVKKSAHIPWSDIIQEIHRADPDISFSYQPDFSATELFIDSIDSLANGKESKNIERNEKTI